ncbi:MAG: cell division protein SepF [Eubacteriales bacterium]
MGVIGKFKDLVIGNDDDDEDEYEDEAQLEETPSAKKVESRNSFIKPKPEGNDLKFNQAPQAQPIRGTMSNPVPFKLIVTEPKGFEDCPRLVDSLKSRKPVIINLEHIEHELARKIFDFLSGATYALGGNVQKVAPNIFVFTPENVDISTNIDSGNLNFPESASKGPWR